MIRAFSCHTILQKSAIVLFFGPIKINVIDKYLAYIRDNKNCDFFFHILLVYLVLQYMFSFQTHPAIRDRIVLLRNDIWNIKKDIVFMIQYLLMEHIQLQ